MLFKAEFRDLKDTNEFSSVFINTFVNVVQYAKVGSWMDVIFLQCSGYGPFNVSVWVLRGFTHNELGVPD